MAATARRRLAAVAGLIGEPGTSWLPAASRTAEREEEEQQFRVQTNVRDTHLPLLSLRFLVLLSLPYFLDLLQLTQ